MTKYDDFKNKLLERITEHRIIKDDFILKINGNAVKYVVIGLDSKGYEFIFCRHDGFSYAIADNIYRDEIDKYDIEWYILEK